VDEHTQNLVFNPIQTKSPVSIKNLITMSIEINDNNGDIYIYIYKRSDDEYLLLYIIRGF
jgi:hypothetical protein